MELDIKKGAIQMIKSEKPKKNGRNRTSESEKC